MKINSCSSSSTDLGRWSVILCRAVCGLWVRLQPFKLPWATEDWKSSKKGLQREHQVCLYCPMTCLGLLLVDSEVLRNTCRCGRICGFLPRFCYKMGLKGEIGQYLLKSSCILSPVHFATTYRILDLSAQQLQVTFISVFITDELSGILWYTVSYFSPQPSTETICLSTEKLISPTLLAATHRTSNKNWLFTSLSYFLHCMSIARSPSWFLWDCTSGRDSWRTYIPTISLAPFAAALEKENTVIALYLSGEKKI